MSSYAVGEVKHTLSTCAASFFEPLYPKEHNTVLLHVRKYQKTLRHIAEDLNIQ
jgi:hypothetical protein